MSCVLDIDDLVFSSIESGAVSDTGFVDSTFIRNYVRGNLHIVALKLHGRLPLPGATDLETALAHNDSHM